MDGLLKIITKRLLHGIYRELLKDCQIWMDGQRWMNSRENDQKWMDGLQK